MWVIAEISVPSVKRFGGVVCAQRTRATPPLSGCPPARKRAAIRLTWRRLYGCRFNRGCAHFVWCSCTVVLGLSFGTREARMRKAQCAVQRGITGIGDPPKVDIARHRISAFRVGRRPEHRRLEPFVRALNDGAQYSGFTLFASAYAGFIK